MLTAALARHAGHTSRRHLSGSVIALRVRARRPYSPEEHTSGRIRLHTKGAYLRARLVGRTHRQQSSGHADRRCTRDARPTGSTAVATTLDAQPHGSCSRCSAARAKWICSCIHTASCSACSRRTSAWTARRAPQGPSQLGSVWGRLWCKLRRLVRHRVDEVVVHRFAQQVTGTALLLGEVDVVSSTRSGKVVKPQATPIPKVDAGRACRLRGAWSATGSMRLPPTGYICIYKYMYIHIYIYICACVHIHIHMHTLFVHTCAYIYIYIYIYIFIYTHMYTYKLLWRS